MFPSFFDLLLFLLSKIAMWDLQFSFLYIKKKSFFLCGSNFICNFAAILYSAYFALAVFVFF